MGTSCPFLMGTSCPFFWSIHLALMKDFFSPDGLLAQKMEGYETRPSQERMAKIVAEALEHRHHAIVEAGTGTGKTLAYLVPALMHGQRLDDLHGNESASGPDLLQGHPAALSGYWTGRFGPHI